MTLHNEVKPAVGMTKQSMALWLLSFQNTQDFEELTRQKQNQLRHELQTFSMSVGEIANDFSDNDARDFLTSMRGLFSKISKSAAVYGIRIGEYRRAGLNHSNTFTLLPSTHNSTDKVAHTVYAALCILNGRLRRCRSCGTFFIRVKRQEFCSTRCSGRARLKRHRRNLASIIQVDSKSSVGP